MMIYFGSLGTLDSRNTVELFKDLKRIYLGIFDFQGLRGAPGIKIGIFLLGFLYPSKSLIFVTTPMNFNQEKLPLPRPVESLL